MKLSKKCFRLLIGCFFCSALLSTAGADAARADGAELPLSDMPQAEQPQADLPLSEPLRIYGTVHKEEGWLLLTDIHGDTALDQLILNVSEETRILDAVNGFPVSAEELQEGESVCAYISQAMALSLPPQSHASMIICRIPEDFAAPSFETADSLTWNEDGSAVLKTVRGNEYMIGSSTTLLPYLTRNIVTAADLTRGRTCLVWSAPQADGQNAASKIVIFAPRQAQHGAGATGPASDPELMAKR